MVALYALLVDARMLESGGCDERAVDALLRRALRDVPEMARDLFDADPDTVFDHWWSGFADINGGPPAADVPTHMIEVKLWAKYNRDQLDRYVDAAPDAKCFVVMPAARALNPGEDISSPSCKGRLEMLRWGNTTAEQWRIVTWESVGTWLRRYLGENPGPTHVTSDDAVSLIASVVRIWGSGRGWP